MFLFFVDSGNKWCPITFSFGSPSFNYNFCILAGEDQQTRTEQERVHATKLTSSLSTIVCASTTVSQQLACNALSLSSVLGPNNFGRQR